VILIWRGFGQKCEISKWPSALENRASVLVIQGKYASRAADNKTAEQQRFIFDSERRGLQIQNKFKTDVETFDNVPHGPNRNVPLN
jgi:hypothetical protein